MQMQLKCLYGKEQFMSFEFAVGGIVAGALLIYLTYALFNAEKL
jgi:K+-transporting ATPase KdpF subunit